MSLRQTTIMHMGQLVNRHFDHVATLPPCHMTITQSISLSRCLVFERNGNCQNCMVAYCKQCYRGYVANWVDGELKVTLTRFLAQG